MYRFGHGRKDLERRSGGMRRWRKAAEQAERQGYFHIPYCYRVRHIAVRFHFAPECRLCRGVLFCASRCAETKAVAGDIKIACCGAYEEHATATLWNVLWRRTFFLYKCHCVLEKAWAWAGRMAKISAAKKSIYPERLLRCCHPSSPIISLCVVLF
jgi:hypothetical protein